MPRAVLMFRLPEEEDEHRAAVNGMAARQLLWDIDQECRALIKYCDVSKDATEFAERIRMLIRSTPESLIE